MKVTAPALAPASTPAAPAANASAESLSFETCEEIRNGHFGASYRLQFQNEIEEYSPEFAAFEKSYISQQTALRDGILHNPAFLKRHENSPKTVQFFYAEFDAHHQMLRKNEHPISYLRSMERVVQQLHGALRQSLNISNADIQAHWKADKNVMNKATSLFSTIVAEFPAHKRSGISPATKMTYCAQFHDHYVRLRKEIPEERLSDQFATYLAHDLALATIQNKLTRPFINAKTFWIENIKTAVRESLGFSETLDKAYEEKIFKNNPDDAQALTAADKAVIGALLSDTHRAKQPALAKRFVAQR